MSDYPPWRCTVMEPDKPVWCTDTAHSRKYPWRERKNIHVWIPLTYHGVIIFVRDWENDFNLTYNLHIILVAAGTQLLTVNPITANHVNKHCSHVHRSSSPPVLEFHILLTAGQQTVTVCLGPLLITITAHWEVATCTSRPTSRQ